MATTVPVRLSPILILAFGIAVLAAIVQIELPIWVALVVLAVMAAAALVWLRVVIHVGLREEATEAGLLLLLRPHT